MVVAEIDLVLNAVGGIDDRFDCRVYEFTRVHVDFDYVADFGLFFRHAPEFYYTLHRRFRVNRDSERKGHLLDATIGPGACVFQSFVQSVELVAKVAQFDFFRMELLLSFNFAGLILLFVAF